MERVLVHLKRSEPDKRDVVIIQPLPRPPLTHNMTLQIRLDNPYYHHPVRDPDSRDGPVRKVLCR
jgi:hypothetical protein